jgi:long-chain acyl-CoA synthetase
MSGYKKQADKTPSFIPSKEAVTLGGLFRQRVARSAQAVGFRDYDADRRAWRDVTWRQMGAEVARWQDAMIKEGLRVGDRVAVMMRNCCEWVMFDQAALALGLITVPIYAEDRGGNVSFILHDSESRLLVIGGQDEWERIEMVLDEVPNVERIVCVKPVTQTVTDPRCVNLTSWLPKQGGALQATDLTCHDLATIVYTSGTTGLPKGVMLSHWNLLSNAEASLQEANLTESDVVLSFLPLSHMLERTLGYYCAIMVGMTIAYVRSIAQLGEDLQSIRPTVLVSVPRIYERIYAKVMGRLEQKGGVTKRLFELGVKVGWKRFLYQQGRAKWGLSLLMWPLLERLVARKLASKLGGAIRLAVSGGAPLMPHISRVFIGLGVPILQGYGMTESSPVICFNRIDDNVPESVGKALEGVEVKIGENEELLARGPNVMMGYWNNQAFSVRVLDHDGWLHTGDKARIDDEGHIYITGRIKEIIVLSNGEKVAPAEMEMAIATDPLIEQVMVIGEQKPFLSAICILNPEQWLDYAYAINVDPQQPRVLEEPEVKCMVLNRIGEHVKSFPGYARILEVYLSLEPWTLENGLMTPTLKLKRAKVLEKLAEPVAKLYEGH